MKERPCILKFKKGSPVEIVMLSGGKDTPNKITMGGKSINLKTADKKEKKKFLKPLMVDVGEMFLEEENEDMRLGFMESMEKVEDIKWFYKSYLKHFAEVYDY